MRIRNYLAEELSNEKQELMKVISKRSKYPDKVLLVSRGSNGYVRRYFRDRSGCTKYISASDKSRLRDIAYGRFLKNQQKILEENIKNLESIISKINNYDPETIIKSLPKSYRETIEGLKDDAALNEVVQSENPKHPEQLRVVCSTGLLVRSKNEMAIAEMLHLYDFQFFYEKALELSKLHVNENGTAYIEKVTVYPDFTILLSDGSVIYWEHFGMMDKDSYRSEFQSKILLYYDNGIYPPKNLIITMDGPGKPFDSLAMRRIVNERLLPLCQ